jgi:hypothetical protein
MIDTGNPRSKRLGQQRRNAFASITAAVKAHRDFQSVPSLLSKA